MKTVLLRLIILVGVVLLGFISVRTYKEYSKKKEIQKEIEALQKEAEKISKENSDFQERLDYFGSEGYIKREAKEKFNLQSPGENVIVIKPSQAKDILSKTEEQKPKETPVVDTRTNLRKWWDYFFRY